MEGVRIVVARFCLDADEHVTPVELRGFVGHAFARISEFHHHSEHSYHYPLVQYKKLGDDLAVVGIGKFARIVLQKMSELDHITTKTQKIPVGSLTVTDDTYRYEPTAKRYRFSTPWLALNREN